MSVLTFRKATEADCGRLEWQCLDWNKPSNDFYLSLGARHKNGWKMGLFYLENGHAEIRGIQAHKMQVSEYMEAES